MRFGTETKMSVEQNNIRHTYDTTFYTAVYVLELGPMPACYWLSRRGRGGGLALPFPQPSSSLPPLCLREGTDRRRMQLQLHLYLQLARFTVPDPVHTRTSEASTRGTHSVLRTL